MIVYMYRHGEAEHNADPTGGTGRLDPPLTHKGVVMCLEARSTVPSFDLVLSSTSTRAIQTAHHIFPQHKIYATNILREYNTGAACNIPLSPDKYSDFPQVDFETYATPDLPKEITFDDGLKRAKDLMIFLNQFKHLERVALVSHGNFISTMLHHLNLPGPSSIGNCRSINFEYKELA